MTLVEQTSVQNASMLGSVFWLCVAGVLMCFALMFSSFWNRRNKREERRLKEQRRELTKWEIDLEKRESAWQKNNYFSSHYPK